MPDIMPPSRIGERLRKEAIAEQEAARSRVDTATKNHTTTVVEWLLDGHTSIEEAAVELGVSVSALRGILASQAISYESTSGFSGGTGCHNVDAATWK